jgi:hypothetical protein
MISGLNNSRKALSNPIWIDSNLLSIDSFLNSSLSALALVNTWSWIVTDTFQIS